VRAATDAATRLESLSATRRARRDEKRWDDYEQKVRRRLDAACRDLYASEDALLVPPFRRAVDVTELNKHAAAPAYEGVVGRRLLNTFATQAGFYLTRQLLERHEYRKAVAALTVVTEALPQQPFYWYDLGCALARSGDKKAALDALEQAAARGFRNSDYMAKDEDLASLRDEARFQALLARLGQDR
jgi:tetratricopeptide (TPR) repeat protein